MLQQFHLLFLFCCWLLPTTLQQINRHYSPANHAATIPSIVSFLLLTFADHTTTDKSSLFSCQPCYNNSIYCLLSLAIILQQINRHSSSTNHAATIPSIVSFLLLTFADHTTTDKSSLFSCQPCYNNSIYCLLSLAIILQQINRHYSPANHAATIPSIVSFLLLTFADHTTRDKSSLFSCQPCYNNSIYCLLSLAIILQQINRHSSSTNHAATIPSIVSFLLLTFADHTTTDKSSLFSCQPCYNNSIYCLLSLAIILQQINRHSSSTNHAVTRASNTPSLLLLLIMLQQINCPWL